MSLSEALAHRCSGLQSLLPKLASVGTPVSITKGVLVGHCGRLAFEELSKLSLLQIAGGDKIPSTFICRDQELDGTEQAGVVSTHWLSIVAYRAHRGLHSNLEQGTLIDACRLQPVLKEK